MRAIHQMPSVALLGSPGSGRSRLLAALAPEARYRTNISARLAAEHGRVRLVDPVLPELARLLGSAKATPLEFEFVDCQAGFAAGQGQSEWFGNLANFDCLAAVLGLFTEPDPAAGLEAALTLVRDELNLWDLGLAERRLQRLDADLARAPRAERAQLDRERSLFVRLAGHLNDGGSLAQLEFLPDESRILRGFGFLGGKPFLAIANTADTAAAGWGSLQSRSGWPLVGVSAELESEAGELDAELQTEMLAEFGIVGEHIAQRVLNAVIQALEIRTCYTANQREARAWAVGTGATAIQLADAVHSDVARGFIRAEVISGPELLEMGGLAQARELGRLRREGRDYRLADQDLVNILFSG